MFHFSSRNLTRKPPAKTCDFRSKKESQWEEIEDQPVSNFKCQLKTRQCEYILSSGRERRRCKNRTRKTLPYCWHHTQIVYNVNVEKSTIKGAGNGLFACDRGKSRGEIVFEKGDPVALYARQATRGKPAVGEYMTNDKLSDRYGECMTGPYSVDTPKRNIGVDTACQRSIGSYANTTRNGRLINTKPMWRKRNTELWLVATKPIRNGEEIMWDYGQSYRLDYPEFFEHNVYHTNTRDSNAKCRKRSSPPRRKRTPRRRSRRRSRRSSSNRRY